MDIALEVCDRYVFDYMYSTVLPASQTAYNVFGGVSNATTFDAKASSSWQYTPASQFISFPPSDLAYMSQWTRDNIYRQYISLFLITWWVLAARLKSSSSDLSLGLLVVQFTSSSQHSPTYSSSTRQPSNTQSSSRIRSRWK
jgi:hypothetical protein